MSEPNDVAAYTETFVQRLEKWSDAEEFIENEGVPGCCVPALSYRELADWWRGKPDPYDAHDLRLDLGDDARPCHARWAVDTMQDSYAAYSPDC